ncbi:ribosomal RNA large subunit methyltransferase I [mine drainage metagenome]|uniref:Ribosomal RNA large subunit methyltransferase I n=1 Tax=mine drainage metagenome TaxID=410659 RepID=A0A1J5S8K7_9ZZZZ
MTDSPATVSPLPADQPSARPVITIQPGRSRRLRAGHPWLFSNEIVMDGAAKALPPGGLVTVMDAGGEKLGVGTFNPHSLIAVRLLSRDWMDGVDAAFLAERLRRAVSLRETLIGRPYYRLIHAEADGLPGLIVDRYGDIVALQANTAGMDQLLPALIEALNGVLAPAVIVLKNDSPVRKLEGLELYDSIAQGQLAGPVELEENGARFLADLVDGQKTGWFYDQRDNRAAVARLARGRSMVDFYTYAGGFAVQAALAGASRVVAVDRSEASLALAARAAALNGVSLETARADSFAEMERLAAAGERFGVVVSDPPAFVKSKKDAAAGAKGYRKMTRLAAALVEPQGFLLVASCSHHMPAEQFAEEVRHGLGQAGRSGRILRAAGAGPDHPLHPHLPESAYLKALLLQLD